MRENVAAILLAGGIGKRAGGFAPKQLQLIGGKPMIVHTLEKMERVPEIKRVVIPCAPETHEKTQYVLDAWGFDPKTHVLVEGGATRQQSVLNGLLALDGFDYVLIHEAARPFASVADYRALLDCEHENALLGAPIPFTVAKVGENGFLDGALERSELVNVQLPQVFKREPLLEAHRKAAETGAEYTEDATLLLDQLGVPSAVVPGSEINIKVTYASDFAVAETLYRTYVVGDINE